MPQFDLNILNTQNINILFFCIGYSFFISIFLLCIYVFKMLYNSSLAIIISNIQLILLSIIYILNLFYVYIHKIKKYHIYQNITEIECNIYTIII